MFKKLTVSVLILTMLASTSVLLTFAENNNEQKATYFNRDIYVNGERIVNYQSASPYFISQNNHTYIPLTAENGQIFGFETKADAGGKTIEIAKADISKQNYANKSPKHTQSVFTVKATDSKLVYRPQSGIAPGAEAALIKAANNLADTADTKEEAGDEADSSGKDKTTGSDARTDSPPQDALPIAPATSPVYLGSDMPVFQYGGVYYAPLSALTSIKELGWSTYYTPYVGLYISTDPAKDAKSYVSQRLVDNNKMLTAYIMKDNGGLSEEKALRLLFLIKQKSQMYGVDELLTLSLIAHESSFNEKAVSKGGALGLMQIMPETGAKAGLTREQLLTAEYNLDFGVKYLSGAIKNFGDSWVKGLSAYNQGSGAVSRGSYSRTYYARVIDSYAELKEKVK